MDAFNVHIDQLLHRKLIGKLGYECHNSLICLFAVSCNQWGGHCFEVALENNLLTSVLSAAVAFAF